MTVVGTAPNTGTVNATATKVGTMADPVVYALALVPAVLWGFSPILSKRGMAGGGSSLQASLVVVAGRGDVFGAPRRTYAYFAGSGTITAVALLSLFAALARGRVAVVDPLAATAPLFTVLFAAVLLRDLERVTRGVVVGAALVVLGAALITAT